MDLIGRLFQVPEGSFFLFGPRGTGKSTWLSTTFPEAVTVDLLDPETFRLYSARPERLREAMAAKPQVRTVIIDEVQKAPALLDLVHKLIESPEGRGLRFILSGSSSRKLKRAGVDLLAGRVLLKTLHPFMAAELGPGFDMQRSLRLGMLPVVLGSPEPEETLSSYVSLYLRDEVQAEGLVRNIGGFSRFLEAASLSHAAILNVASLARDCQVGQKAAESYLDILESLMLGFRLRAFTKRAKRHLVQHPKFYFFDAGVFRSLRPKGPLDSPQEAGGGALEGLVAQHLRAWTAYGKAGAGLYYWRTKSGSEVDFVVYGEATFSAIEVKSSAWPQRRDVRPLKAFLADYPQARACLLHGGREALRIEGIPCLPCEGFLRGLVPGQALEGLIT